MSRNRLIGASFILFAMATCAPRLCQAQTKPNILVIMADDVGWMNVASYGGDVMGVKTLIDGVDVPDSTDRVEGDLFADGEAHDIVLTVTPRTVTATVDGKDIIHWEGDPSLLRQYDHIKGVDAPLFIRPYTDFFVSDLKFEAIDVVEVSEPEK